jgi:hypothetical protein
MKLALVKIDEHHLLKLRFINNAQISDSKIYRNLLQPYATAHIMSKGIRKASSNLKSSTETSYTNTYIILLINSA